MLQSVVVAGGEPMNPIPCNPGAGGDLVEVEAGLLQIGKHFAQ
jgi:hypothetical protein